MCWTVGSWLAIIEAGEPTSSEDERLIASIDAVGAAERPTIHGADGFTLAHERMESVPPLAGESFNPRMVGEPWCRPSNICP